MNIEQILPEDSVAEIELRHAISQGEMAKVQFLVETGVDLEAKDPWGNTALHDAVCYENTEIAALLIKNGADVNAKGFREYTPLHMAVLNDNVKITQLLAQNGADINAKDCWGKTALDYASYTELIGEIL